MGKVFRYHKGDNAIEDWQTSQAYGRRAIDAIEDPAGATSRREITSIPSPFARIDLVKTAFENIVNGQKLDGNTIFHKMVSEAFDVGQILFNLDRFQDKVKIIVWDKDRDLRKLLDSDNNRHRSLGKTLQLYLQQDASANNFDALQRIYLLNYTGGPDPINIIGGTSPVSLFFTSANKLSDYVDIPFGNHRAFGEKYQPLYDRDFEYQKYIYGLKEFSPGFNRYFSAVHDYLDQNFRALTSEQRDAINGLTQADIEGRYATLSVGNDGNRVELLGYPLRKRVENPTNIEQRSGFVIDSVKYAGAVKPLVLPIDTYAQSVQYTSATWDSHNKAPVYDELSLNERTLPFDGSKYPYLTISDLLEPYIIRTIYPINKSKFFDGNFSQRDGEASKGYLLPLKKAYFDFFDTTDLQGVTSDGKKRIEIRQGVAGGVHVTLRVPVQNGNHIAYERTYYPPSNDHEIAQPDEQNNKGAVIENQFGLAIYPFLKLEDEKLNCYRIALIDRDLLPHTSGNKYAIELHSNFKNANVAPQGKRTRSNKNTDLATSDYYVVENEGFDYIQVKHNWASGIVIPLFRPVPMGTSSFTFAIDFGTTNTHIEYRKDGAAPKPFEIEQQLVSLYDSSDQVTQKALKKEGAETLTDILRFEFLPETIGRDSEFGFPQRTVVQHHVSMDLTSSIYALADMNIPFYYEIYPYFPPKNAKVRTNLKWSDYTHNPNEVKIIQTYFENLLLLIRSKVLSNQGDLAQTKIVWLYPSSMTVFRKNKLEEKWREVYRKYISDTGALANISESIAPFYYYNKIKGVVAEAVSIDIGGGTSDVVIYANDTPQVITSFRFAANSVFGDAIGKSKAMNGFSVKYRDILAKQGLLTWFPIENIEQSEDIISYLFSVEHSKRLKDENKEFSLYKMLLEDGDFRVVFLIFYASIIYHIAHIIRLKGLTVPKHITFSGTGSKIINFAEGNSSLSGLSVLTKLIFNKVVEKGEIIEKVQIFQVDNPKEISCKGALMIDDSKVLNISDMTVLVGDGQGIRPIKYNDVDDKLRKDIIGEYYSFVDFFFALHEDLNFKQTFGLNPANFHRYKDYLKENAMDGLTRNINEKVKELSGDTDADLEETLFFYPLIGGLNHLAYMVIQDKK